MQKLIGRHIVKSFSVEPENSSLLIAEAFGIGPGWVNRIVDIQTPDPLPTITLITGESGCGKSTLLRELGQPSEFAIPNKPLHAWADSDEEALRLLNSVGLNDASLFVLHYHQLSDSQQARARMYFWLCQRKTQLFVDEFLSTLDRKTAQALAYSFQKMLRREKIQLVAATAHDDLDGYLKPELIIRGTAFPSDWTQETPQYDTKNPFESLVTVGQETDKSDRDTPGAKCKNVMSRKEVERFHERVENTSFPRVMGDVCWGTMTYAPFCECGENRKPNISPGKDAYRNSRLGEIHYKGKYVGAPQEYFSARLEKKIVGWLVGVTTRQKGYRISRVVVHPTYRGCGVGQRLIRAYLNIHPDCDTVAAMARFNPVFERAGMRRVEDIDVPIRKEFKDFPLTPFQWASKEECQKFLESNPVYFEKLIQCASALTSDIHPGGVVFDSERELQKYLKSNIQVAARVLWKARPKKMAKYVGPAHA